MVLLFVVVLLLLPSERLEIGNFCFFSPKGRQGGGGLLTLLTLLLARRRKRRRLRVHDDGKDEALLCVVKVVDVIIFIILLVILLSVMPFRVKFREKTSDFSHERKNNFARLFKTTTPVLFSMVVMMIQTTF